MSARMLGLTRHAPCKRAPARWGAVAIAACLTACASTPEFRAPTLEATALGDTYRHVAGTAAVGGPAAPLPVEWWRWFADERLDALVERADAHNQDLELAQARWEQSRFLADASEARLWPFVTVNTGVTRGNRSGTAGNGGSGVANRPSVGLAASWEADVWGRLSMQQRASSASARASQSDLAAARLSIQASTAQAYFALQSLAAQQRLLDDTVAAYERFLQLTQNRYQVGVASRADVAQAQTLLQTTRTQAIENRVLQAQTKHALAVLVGSTPAQFGAGPPVEAQTPLTASRPVPAGVPSELLRRRPDIAAALARVEAAHASAGVAQTAFYPSLTLSAATAFQSSRWSTWLDAPSHVWSLGAAVAATLFDGGERRAIKGAAEAALRAASAQYRQSVLTAFQEVEDQLLAVQLLEEAASVQALAVQAARDALDQTLHRYRAGAVDTLSVLIVQTTALNAERTALVLQARQLSARVDLIKALGGGWQSADVTPVARQPTPPLSAP